MIGTCSYPVLGDMQVPTPAMPNTFQAIAFDLTDYHGPFGSVHIRDKTTVGQRLALAGIATAYGDASVYAQGPTVASATLSSSQGACLPNDISITEE